MNKLFDKFLNVLVNLSQTKALTAVKDGFILTMPVTLIGSLFLLVGALPIDAFHTFMVSTFGAGWTDGIWQVVGGTFDIIAIITVVGIAYNYAKNEKEDGISCAIFALISFIIITSSTILSESGEFIGGVIPKVWTGAQGVITAIIIGLVVGVVFTWFVKKKYTIKMPAGVPDGVSRSFAALIPGFVIVLGSMIAFQILSVSGTTLTEFIFNSLQIPLQNMSDSFVGGLFIVLLMSLLFWAGIHGPNIVMGIMAPILTANAIANSDLAAKGLLSLSEGARIVTPQVIDNFVKFGGTSITLGLIIAVLLRAKSQQMREISKLSLIPGIFNINEPMIFGLPIVYNPFMLVPFIIVPVIAYALTYFAIWSGFIAPFTAIQVPWTMPAIFSGFILAGWQGAVLQIVILVMAIAVYYPFMAMQDKKLYEEEQRFINE